MKLYTYAKSSAAYRVRIALNIKGLAYDPHYIHLIKNGGENFSPQFKIINPQQMVPVLQLEDLTLQQSLAIIEYLNETNPNPALLPAKPGDRAYVRALALMIGCDIHPLNNLRVLDYLKNNFNISEDEKRIWYQHWIIEGFNAIEKILSENSNTGKYCFGDTVTLADIVLVPQVYNAIRYNCNLSTYPNIARIYSTCMQLDAFQHAAPENQADFEP